MRNGIRLLGLLVLGLLVCGGLVPSPAVGQTPDAAGLSSIRTEMNEGASLSPARLAFVFRYGLPDRTALRASRSPSSRGSSFFARGRLPARPADRWVAMDKAKHVGGSLLWTLSTQYVLVAKAGWSEGDALPVSVASGAAVGVAKEVMDRTTGPTRHFSTKDLVADAVGVALGALIIAL